VLMPFAAGAATNDLSSALQQGLFEEEANRNLPAAMEAYEKVAKQFDQNRALAATAIFRLGEVNRKLGKTNEAAAFYQRILREFGDQDTLVKLSQQNLAGMGMGPTIDGKPLPNSQDWLRAELTKAEAKLSSLKVDYTGEHPTVRAQAALVDSIRTRLAGVDAGVYPTATASDETARLAQQIAAIADLKNDPEKQARTVQALFPDEGLKRMLLHLPLLQAQEAMFKGKLPEKIEGVYHAMPASGGSDLLEVGLRPNSFGLAEAKAEVQKQFQYISERVNFILGLQKERLQFLQSLTASGGSGGATQVPITAVLDEEETEIRRIQAMIQNSPDLINAPSGEEGTPLYRAASKGQLRVAAFLLDHGADVNTRAGIRNNVAESWTPLYTAANQGHRAMVELLASRGAEVNAKVELGSGFILRGSTSSSGRTALHRAVEKGFQAVAEALLANKADINARDKSGGTPLHLAASKGHSGLTAYLLSKGADVNATDGEGGTALMEAASRGHAGTIKMLITAKAGINAETTAGRTALSFAAGGGHLDSVTALLAAKADPNAGMVNLPLHCAIQSQSTGIVEALLKAGADANRVGKVTWAVAGESPGAVIWTPLAMAVRGEQTEIVKLLLAHKADPNNRDCGQLIFFAVNNPDLMKALLDAGANPNVDDGGPIRTTPLGRATDPKVIGLLLAAGANPNAPTAGFAPLLWAANSERTDQAEALLKGGAEVGAKLWDGRTALHLVAQLQNVDLAKLLLAYKADLNARDNEGLTPLDFALGKNRSPNSPPASLRSQAPISRIAAAPIPDGTNTVADLLRQHGGLADLPKLDRIEVTRPETGYRATAFMVGTNGWNQFTLAEVLAQQWGLLSTRLRGSWEPSPSYYQERNKIWGNNPIRFPDLACVKVHRFVKETNARVTTNLDFAVRGTDAPLPKVVLQMGDLVEVPEADHPVNEVWVGLSRSDNAVLNDSIARRLTIIVNGKSTNLTFAPRIEPVGPSTVILVFPASFMIRSVLDESKLIRSSSDLTRVKVTRRESANAKPRVWVVDCSVPDKAPDLWLRDGDVIEVPEK
jgi:ankyrin repeat protein